MPLLETVSTIGSLLTSPFNYAAQNAQLNKQRKWAVEDRDYQNKYNAPKAAVARNREAGLPLAALFGGAGAGGQSDQPRGTTIQPQLESERAIEGFNQTRMNNAQLELLRENTRQAKAEADLKIAERDVLLRPTGGEGEIGTGFLSKSNVWTPYSNLENNMRTEQFYKTNQVEIQRIQRSMDAMEEEVYRKLKEQGIQVSMYEAQKNKVLKEIEALGLDLTDRQNMINWTSEQWANINKMEEGPLKIVMGLIFKLIDGMATRGR